MFYRFRLEILLYRYNLDVGNAHHDDTLVLRKMIDLMTVYLYSLLGFIVIPIRRLILILRLIGKLNTILISQELCKQIFPLIPLQMGE